MSSLTFKFFCSICILFHLFLIPLLLLTKHSTVCTICYTTYKRFCCLNEIRNIVFNLSIETTEEKSTFLKSIWPDHNNNSRFSCFNLALRISEGTIPRNIKMWHRKLCRTVCLVLIVMWSSSLALIISPSFSMKWCVEEVIYTLCNNKINHAVGTFLGVSAHWPMTLFLKPVIPTSAPGLLYWPCHHYWN